MALTGWSTSNYLMANVPIWPGQLPFVVSIWAWKDAPVTSGSAYSLGQLGSLDQTRRLHHVPGVGPSWTTSRSTTASMAQAVDGPDGAWYHWAGSFVASNLREGWIAGANKATDAADIVVGAPDSTFIGVRADAAAPWASTDALASFSAWDAAGLTEQERDDLVAALAGGTNPLTLNLENEALVGYAELEDTNDLGPFSMQGSLSVFDSHPPISAPTKSSTGFRRRGVRVITGADPQFPLPVRKHRQIAADPKYRRHILHQDPDAPIRRWVQVVPGPLPARKQVSIEGL